MSPQEKPSKSDSFFKILKNMFMLLVILSLAPIMLSSIKSWFEESLFPKAEVGYLSIYGDIVDSGFYARRIEEFSKDPHIKALLIRINSPGGLPGSSQAIFNELKRFKQNKPVVVFVENMCASGAYYIALAANSIIANPSSLVGSVGVLMGIPNLKQLMTQWKVDYIYIQSGAYKTATGTWKDMSSKERAYLQALSDDNYQQFVKDVAECRKISPKETSTWADGKVFTGTQALKLKLIDKLGSYLDAVAEIKRLTKLKPYDEIKLVQPRRLPQLLRTITGEEDFGNDSSMADHVALFASDVYKKFMVCQASPSNPTFS